MIISEIVSLKEACQLLHVHPNTLRLWDSKGILKAIRLGKRKDRRYYREDLLKILRKDQKIQPSTVVPYEIYFSDKIKSAWDRMAKLQKLVTQLSEMIEVTAMAELITSELATLLQASNVGIYTLSSDRKHLQLLGSLGIVKKVQRKLVLLPITEKCPLTDAFSKNEILFFNSNEQKIMYPQTKGDAQTIVLIPLVPDGYSNGSIGVIEVQFPTNVGFQYDDLSYFMSLGKLCGQALYRAGVFATERKDKEKAKEMESTFEQLHKAGIKVLMPLGMNDVYRIIVDESRKLAHAEYSSIFLYKSGKLERVYTNAKELKNVYPRKNSNTFQAFSKKKSIISEVSHTQKIIRDLGIQAVLAIPLLYRNKAAGVLTLLSKNKKQFTKESMYILELFGVMAMLAIKKNSAYQEAKEALHTQDLFISMASHELKSPLTTISLYNQLLEARITEPTLREMLASQSHEIERIGGLVNELLLVNNINRGSLQFTFKNCNIIEIVNRAVKDFKLRYPERKLVLDVEDIQGDGIIHADYDKILQTILNLLHNAAKFSENHTEIQLTLCELSRFFQMKILDQGQGIAKKELPYIFQSFYRGSNTGGGMGLGLYLAKNIIDAHKGHIAIESKINIGTTVTVEIPIY